LFAFLKQLNSDYTEIPGADDSLLSLQKKRACLEQQISHYFRMFAADCIKEKICANCFSASRPVPPDKSFTAGKSVYHNDVSIFMCATA
jgi:hypothetical protein